MGDVDVWRRARERKLNKGETTGEIGFCFVFLGNLSSLKFLPNNTQMTRVY